jgi:integrase
VIKKVLWRDQNYRKWREARRTTQSSSDRSQSTEVRARAWRNEHSNRAPSSQPPAATRPKSSSGASPTTNAFFLVTQKARNRRSPKEGLAIPEGDKLQMKIESRGEISFSRLQTKQIGDQVHKLEVDHTRKERYATVFLLAAATGLRGGELFALKWNDIHRRNCTRTGAGGVFQHRIGEYGKWPVCTCRLVGYNLPA